MARTSRDDVIAAAGRLFADRGFHGTSMRDLGDELGLLGSSLYSHVSSKEELLVEVIARGAAKFEEAAAAARAGDASADEVIRRLVVGHVDVLVEHASEARTFLDEARFLETEERAKAIAMRDDYERVWREVIAAGVEKGELREVDPDLGSIFALSTLNALVRWYDPAGRLTKSELADDIAAYVLEGLGA